MDAVESAVIDWGGCRFCLMVLRDFTADACSSGVGAFLVFVPQIFVLTL